MALTISRRPWSLSPQDVTVVLDSNGVIIANFADPRDAEAVVVAFQGDLLPQELREELEAAQLHEQALEEELAAKEDALAELEAENKRLQEAAKP